MIKVLFICHGNICRSTMAEYVMKDLVKKANLESSFYIDSAGTSNEEDGIRDRSPSRGLGDVYKRQPYFTPFADDIMRK